MKTDFDFKTIINEELRQINGEGRTKSVKLTEVLNILDNTIEQLETEVIGMKLVEGASNKIIKVSEIINVISAMRHELAHNV